MSLLDKISTELMVKMQQKAVWHLWLLMTTVVSVSVSGFPTSLKRTSVRDRNPTASVTEVNYPAVLHACQIIGVLSIDIQ